MLRFNISVSREAELFCDQKALGPYFKLSIAQYFQSQRPAPLQNPVILESEETLVTSQSNLILKTDIFSPASLTDGQPLFSITPVAEFSREDSQGMNMMKGQNQPFTQGVKAPVSKTAGCKQRCQTLKSDFQNNEIQNLQSQDCNVKTCRPPYLGPSQVFSLAQGVALTIRDAKCFSSTDVFK